MNDSELNRMLKSAEMPRRPQEYWAEFPRRVVATIERREREGAIEGWHRPTRSAEWLQRVWNWKPVLALGAVCILIGVSYMAGVWQGQRGGRVSREPSLAQVEKYLQEVQELFPRQIEAIVFDDSGPRLVLSEKADVPVSTPLYLKICGPNGCKRIVTFSGQEIRINGETCDVLVDHRGTIILAGRNFLWCSSGVMENAGEYRISAEAIETRS